MWNAAEYLKFTDERSRPFADLLSQVRISDPRFIADLGCGTGNLTRHLAERWPEARVLGIDSSQEMLKQTEPLTIPGRLEFVRADLAEWSAAAPFDLIVSNAALHWLGDHEALFPRFARMLAPRGTLAVQMPNRFHTPSHAAVEETASDQRWSSTLQGIGLHRESVKPLSWYIHTFIDLGFSVNAWETTYFHVMKGENPVLEWLKGTALRPLLARLPHEHVGEFLQSLGSRLKDHYPARNGIALFPMPRLFFVATR